MYLKLSCLIPEPSLESRASHYMDKCVEWMETHFGDMGVNVEVPDED